MDFTSIQSFEEGGEKTLEMQLFENIAEAGVLMAPGWFFSTSEALDTGVGHFRISFSSAEVRFVIPVWCPHHPNSPLSMRP